MAVVNIPIGGQVVGIEIPDFAMETTQRDIFDLARDQLAALRSIEAEITGQTSTLQSIASRSGSGGGPGGGGPSGGGPGSGAGAGGGAGGSDSSTQKLLDGFRSFESRFQEQSASTVIEQISGVLGLGAAGAVAGTIVGVLEKFGEALSKVGRVGVGLGETMAELREVSADVGTTFDKFTAIVATNGAQMLNFGENTGAGAMSLGRLAAEFRNASRGMGQFGLANDEMIQLLIEEAEMRRLTTGELFRTDTALGGLASRVTENMKLQEAMARITGQDVRDRIAGQRAIQTNVIAQEFLSNQTGEFAEKMTALGASLENVPGGDRIMNAFIASIATGRDFRAFDTALFAQLGIPVANLFETFTEGLYDTGTDATELSAALAAGVSDMRNVGDQLGETLVQLAASGNQESMLALAIRNNIRELGTTEEILIKINENYEALESGITDIRGITPETERLAAELINTVTQRAIDVVETAGLVVNIDEPGNALVAGIRGLADLVGEADEFLGLHLDAFQTRFAEFLSTEIDTTNTDGSGTTADGVGNPVNPITGQPAVPGAQLPASEGGPIPISFPVDDMRSAFEQALMAIVANGGLPVNVRNFRDIPTPPIASTTAT